MKSCDIYFAGNIELIFTVGKDINEDEAEGFRSFVEHNDKYSYKLILLNGKSIQIIKYNILYIEYN